MIVLGREVYSTCIVGCCGSVRNDYIYPVNWYPDLENFKMYVIEALSKGNILKIEQYEAEDNEDQRGDGEEIYKIEKEENEYWAFYERGKKVFSFSSVEELKVKWNMK